MNEKSWLKVAPNRAVKVFGEVQRPGRIEWSDEMSFIDLLAHVGGPKINADTTKIEIVTPDSNGVNQVYIFDLDSHIANGSPKSNLPLIKAGATIRVNNLQKELANNKSVWLNQKSNDSIYVFGQVNAAGRYRFTNDMHFLDILSAADGPTMNADIHNIRITHRDKNYSRVSKLNLTLYFETGDESLLPIVKTGDTIFIPEKNRLWVDQSKETTIRVLGSINKPGRYRFNDSMTLLDLLAEAGGPDNDAYLEKISVVNHSLDGGQARTFNLVEFSRTGDFRNIPVLRAGDTVYIPNKDESFVEQARIILGDVLEVLAVIVIIGAL